MQNNEVGRRIRGLRRLKRMTQQQLAGHLDLSASQLSNIERGLKKPRPELLEKIAAALDVAGEEFFFLPAKGCFKKAAK
ncbi:MAG: helix-turn-helix transcriptional regulator [Bacillota bacterium]